jgi:hypothetical protein
MSDEEQANQRAKWTRALHSNFFKALDKSTQEFTWQEKADFFELLMQYIEALQKSEEEAAVFFTDKIMKPLRSKLQPATKEKLFTYFNKELAFVELGIISTETFNALRYEEQGMTDEDFKWYLEALTRVLKSQQYFHYIYAHDGEEESKQDSVEGITNTKGRIQRSSGDNLTKLNQEQTALLINYLKENRMILRDEYLNDKQAGMAFSILTGYSPDNLRIKISKKEISKIKNKENLKELDNVLTTLKLLIERDIKGHK